MLQSPPESHEIKQQWGNRFAGGSKNNPFLKPPEDRFTSYNETIAPQKICKGILEIREQLVAEWIEDLALIPLDNAQFIHDQQQNLSIAYEVCPSASTLMRARRLSSDAAAGRVGRRGGARIRQLHRAEHGHGQLGQHAPPHEELRRAQEGPANHCDERARCASVPMLHLP